MTDNQWLELCCWCYQQGWSDAAKTVGDITPNVEKMRDILLSRFAAATSV